MKLQQLNAQDVGFIYQESIKTPMHISSLGIFDQSTANTQRTSKKQIIEYLSQRVHKAPILRQKLLHTPLEWERPYWLNDAEFDMDYHVRRIQLQAPGNKDQLNALVSTLMQTPLDMDKPLWEIYFIEGLNDFPDIGQNSFAMLTKIHHSCVDGGSGNNLYAALVDVEQQPENMVMAGAVDEASVPGRYEMLANAYGRNTVSAIEQTIALSKRLPSLAKVANQLYRGEKQAGASLSVPLTRFNRTPDAERSLASTAFDLAAIKAMRRSIPGITMNDVVGCIIAGGLRAFLQAKGELPETSLGAMMPKNLRKGVEHKASSGNKVGGLFACIHTNIEDPKQRLQAINQSTKAAKAFADEMDTAAFFPNMMGGFLYPKAGKALMKLMQKHRLMERVGPVMLNTVITNVIGPPVDLFHAGAIQHSFVGMPPLIDGVALCHAVFTHKKQVTLAVVSCPAMIDDGQFYIQCMEQSFLQLQAAVQK